MTGLLFPELLLLVVPAALAWWFTRGTGRLGDAVRVSLVLTLIIALAAPYLRRPSTGRDVVVVVDRSRSMPEDADERATELIRLVEEQRGGGDRLGVVAFGRTPVVEQTPSSEVRFQAFERAVDADGSDLAAALERALQLVGEERAGRILVVSDGELTGRDAVAIARRAAARGIEIHTKSAEREVGEDLAVVQMDLPDRVDIGQPWLFTAWVRTDRAGEHGYELLRDGQVLARGTRRFEAGLNRMQFRDRLDEAGVATYELRILGADDRVPDNDTGLGAVLAVGPKPVLLLNDAGAPSTLSAALVSGGLSVEVASPETRRLSAVSLTRYRAVVLENVDAGRIGHEGLGALADFVENRGGGLLITGGQASFGVGGYHESALDPVLPVSMELRQEHRKIGLAMAIVMDRSGSMSMEAAPGVTKMDLANDGAGAAIRLLTPIDAVAVTAVDSEAHRVMPLTPIRDPEAMAREVSRVKSMGGGIYTYNGLMAAKRELAGAKHPNKHIVLFTDAADTEQQQGCLDLADELFGAGVTISVIALGTEQDPDADFIKQLADHGGGEAYFTTRPQELPRLFAMDTLVAARASFVEEPTAASFQPGIHGLGEAPAAGFPTLAGYNLCWLVPGASQGLVTLDENSAPLLAFHQVGLGRVVAYTGQVGGSHGQELLAWEGFSELFVTTGRYLAVNEEPGDWYAGVRREGQEAVVLLQAAGEVDLPAVSVSLLDPSGEERVLAPVRVAEDRYELRVPLSQAGVTIGTVILDDTPLELPPMALVNSPEFKHRRDSAEGRRTLRRLAEVSGGRSEGTVEGLFEGDAEGVAARVISRELALLALLLLLLEIAGRRLRFWGTVEAAVEDLAPKSSSKPAPRRPSGSAQSRQDTEPEEPPEPPEPEPESGLGSALGKARKKAKKKLDR